MTTPVLGLANDTLLEFTTLAMTSGSDHLNRSLPVTFLLLELTRCFLYMTLSPTLNWWGLRPLLNLWATLLRADFRLW